MKKRRTKSISLLNLPGNESDIIMDYIEAHQLKSKDENIVQNKRNPTTSRLRNLPEIITCLYHRNSIFLHRRKEIMILHR